MKHLLSLLTLLSLTTTGGLTTTTAHAGHCPGCDTTEPSYGSSAYERRYDAGKYQEGNGQYPREREKTNVDRYNEEQRQRQDQRRENSRDTGEGYRRGYSGAFRGEGGGDTCKGLYGC